MGLARTPVAIWQSSSQQFHAGVEFANPACAVMHGDGRTTWTTTAVPHGCLSPAAPDTMLAKRGVRRRRAARFLTLAASARYRAPAA